MNFNPNQLFFTMCDLFAKRVTKESKLIIGNEGSSRSSKTWDTFHFLVALCDHNRSKPLDIYILRDTLVNCRDFTMKEFQDCLTTIGIYDPNMMVQSPKPVYNLFGHKIKFRGLDDEQSAEGYPSDVLFFNEVLEQSRSGVMGLIMRCRMLTIMDWNPKYSDHWVFDMDKRDDTVFTHSTYQQNRHLQKAIRKEIESYDPDVPENVANGTADKYRWEVYGLGKRASREGLVFPDVTWVNAFPTDLEQISYGMDFGKTAQTAIVRTGVRSNERGADLYIQNLFYAPTENSQMISDVLNQLKIESHIWADNNQPGWVGDLRRNGHGILTTKKFPGSREYWIATIKRFKIHIVKDPHFRKEQENFCYRVVDGKQLSETIKAYDHLWSATGYSVVGDFRTYVSELTDEPRTTDEPQSAHST